jgi:hypothetical protein
LAGTLICIGCGQKMNSHSVEHIRKSGEVVRTVSYRCRTHAQFVAGQTPKDCPRPESISERVALRQIAVFLKAVMQDEGPIELAIDMILEQSGAAPNGNEGELRSGLEASEKELATLVGRLGLVPDSALPDVKRRMEELAAMRDGYNKALAEVSSARSKVRSPEDIREALRRAQASMDRILVDMPPAEVNATLRDVMPGGFPVANRQIAWGAMADIMQQRWEAEGRPTYR